MRLILRWHPAGRWAGLFAAAAFLGAGGAHAQQAAAAASPKVEESPPALSSTARAGLWVAAAGGATLLAGVATGFVAKAREQEAWSACRHGSGGPPVCPESTRADFDAARTFATVTNVLLFGGGLLSVTGLGLVIVTPTLSHDGPSVAITGAF